jgi:hypothetical protein
MEISLQKAASGDKISFPKRELIQRVYRDMSATLGDKRPSHSTVKNWVASVTVGHLGNEDEERSGRPTQVTIPEKVDNINSMILDDRRIPAKEIAETLAISRERVGYIIHKILLMRKLSSK